MKKTLLLIALFAGIVAAQPAPTYAAGDGAVPPEMEWSFRGFNPSWDVEQIFRGYKVATQVCMACHSFKYIKHRDLMKLGFSEDQVKILAEELGLGMDDAFISSLTEEAAQMSYGTAVPDLSVMNMARPHGADYLHALLTGYEDAPEGVSVPEGKHYNKYFPGHVIAMPAPLTMEGQVEYPEGSKVQPTVEQMSTDVAAFIEWTGEPILVKRKNLGVYVLIYLLIFTILSYMLMKRIWADVKKKD